MGLIYVECSRHEIGIKKFFDNVQKSFDITVNPPIVDSAIDWIFSAIVVFSAI